MSVIRQPSLFGTAATAPDLDDLAGLLIAGGTITRWVPPVVAATADRLLPRARDQAEDLGGRTGRASDGAGAAQAQLSIVVDHPWRASVLVMECARRGLAATTVSTVEQRIGVRTAHSPLLRPLADTWSDGIAPRIPRDLVLAGWQLRLWVEAEGRYERPGTYLLSSGPLSSGPGADMDRQRVGAALAAVGLGAQVIRARRGGGYSYRIVGKRRLERLAEMVGDPPKRAPTDIWPS